MLCYGMHYVLITFSLFDTQEKRLFCRPKFGGFFFRERAPEQKEEHWPRKYCRSSSCE